MRRFLDAILNSFIVICRFALTLWYFYSSMVLCISDALHSITFLHSQLLFISYIVLCSPIDICVSLPTRMMNMFPKRMTFNIFVLNGKRPSRNLSIYLSSGKWIWIVFFLSLLMLAVIVVVICVCWLSVC